MANNKGIQILRTDLQGITSARQNLEILAGQPLYNAQKNYLTVGGPTGGTAKAAPNEHTHSYGSTTALTTTANNGSAVAAVTEVKPD